MLGGFNRGFCPCPGVVRPGGVVDFGADGDFAAPVIPSDVDGGVFDEGPIYWKETEPGKTDFELLGLLDGCGVSG